MTSDEASNEIQFPVPKGYEIPPSAKEGKEFTAVATFRFDEEGATLALTKIEGVPVSSEAPEEKEEGPETSPEMMSALSQPGAPAASTY